MNTILQYSSRQVRWAPMLALITFCAPLNIIFAQTGVRTLKGIITDTVLPIFNSIIGLIMVLAVLGFIFGIIRFMYTAGDDKSREYGKNIMLWGTIVLMVMVSVWGIVAIIQATFFG